MVASKRVLVVDDEDVVCRSYERVLNNAGFEVEKANDGSQAFDRIGEREYDVMLADLRMPGMDGLQLVRKLREKHPKLPVIVVTGYPSQDTLVEAARLGVTEYLTKPVAPDVLTQATTQALAGPGWNDSPSYLNSATVPAMGPVAQVVAPVVVPEGMPVVAVAAPVVKAEVAPVVVEEPGIVGTTVRLCGGLATSLAYVMFLPLAGFFVLLGLGSKAMFTKLVTKGA